MVTLKEVAEICNVSAATVSNVINGKAKTSEATRKRILQVIEETGYKPNYMAKGLRTNRTKIISIVTEDIAQFTSPPIIESIMEQCEKHDYHVYVHNLRLYDRWQDTWYDQDKDYHSVLDPVLQDVLSARAEGVIYLAGHTRIINFYNDNFNLPTVMCYSLSNSPAIPSVVIEDEKSAYEVTSYLVKNGHKRIGFVGGRAENIHTAQRLLGYQRALFENGILFDPNLVYYGDWSRESGYEGAKTLLPQGVTAFFGISDKMTGGIYDYLIECGLQIGKEIAVVGFDNESISEHFYPPLTTTTLPLAEIGRISADLLIDMLENDQPEELPEEPKVVRIPCSMEIRKSVCRR
ncbi:LacI family DNA-binding transcriptional regulator [Butyrivibrio sp. INlla16]|uniref:LacI family DNA-binding transcriptional regulator n=1 Tax=Butyrivibrio sp. INlla16 TaxID=1520807 RepID=UPI00088093DE|nr:LacI family DNA-binding transcriptional regulator [Butyrivibrio sp. INlla16]SDB59840.1 LacI family transcriptional regulator [Butyrivibrio sp. INlla16]